MGMEDSRTTRRQFLGAVALGGATVTATGGAVTARNGDSTTPTGDVAFHKGITYASREAGDYQTAGDLELDLYLPESDDPTPLVVYIHGGGWITGSRKATPDLRTYFASRGYAMATIDYRYTFVRDGVDPIIPANDSHPKGEYPDQIVDVKAAIRWLRANAEEYNIDPNNVATWGSSAGAHLAALAGTVDDVGDVAGDVYPASAVEPTVHPEESGRVQAVVPWYSPTNFLKMDEQASERGWFEHDARNSPESMLLGGKITEYPDRVTRANPITYVDSDDPPYLLMHGRQDGTVAYEQSEILYEALESACVDATSYELHNLGHGFGFEQLTQNPVPEQTIFETQACKQSPGEGSPPDDHRKNGPPAGPKVIEQFLDRNLAH